MGNLLRLYKEWMGSKTITSIDKHGLRIEACGLCNAVPDQYKDLLEEYFKPTDEERIQLSEEGFSPSYWAYGKKCFSVDGNVTSDFTELRQNIVLLMAAMCDEL